MVLRFDITAESLRFSRWIQMGESRFATSASRLSTGLRIDTAAADASGSFLATKLQAQTAGWHRAQQNIQDGVSLAQAADSAFSTLNDLVNRIRELAVQSANGVYSDAERTMLQAEVSQLRQEIVQVVQRTTFNGVSLLQGTAYQPPPVVDVDGAVAGDPAYAASLAGQTTFDGVTLTAGGADPYLTAGLEGPTQAFGTVDTKSGTYEVVVTAAPVQARVVGGIFPLGIPGAAAPAINVTITGSSGTTTVALNGGDTVAAWVAALSAPAVTAATGVTAALEGAGPATRLVFRSATGGSSQFVQVTAVSLDPLISPEDYIGFGPGLISDTGEDFSATVNGAAATVTAGATTMALNVYAPGNDAHGLTLTIDTSLGLPAPYSTGAGSAGFVNVLGLASETQDLQLAIQAGPNSPDQKVLIVKPMNIGVMDADGSDASTTNDLAALDISTQSGALAALDVAGAALEQIATARATLGASWSSLEQSLGIAAVNEGEQRAADARISDADVASESTQLIMAQIQTETASAAMAHVQADAARTLQLIANAQVDLQIVSPEAPPAPSGGAAALAPPPPPAVSGSGGALGPPSFGGSVFASPSIVGAPSQFGGYSPMPVTPGFSPQPATPAYSPVAVTPGYAALPVMGSRSAAEVATVISGLSTSQMFGLIAGGLSQ